MGKDFRSQHAVHCVLQKIDYVVVPHKWHTHPGSVRSGWSMDITTARVASWQKAVLTVGLSAVAAAAVPMLRWRSWQTVAALLSQWRSSHISLLHH